MTDPADDDVPNLSRYYPTDHMPLAGQLPDIRPAFNRVREAFLLNYNLRTAKAYWSDLEQIADWAEERGKDPLRLTPMDIKQHQSLLRRRNYGESTVRRRGIAYALLLKTIRC